MARLDRVPNRMIGRSALVGLVVLAAGCAQFQWSGLGPGAPGQRTPGPSREALAAAAHEDRDHALPSIEPAPPFPLADRDRIAPIQPIVEDVAARYDMDPDLINGVIWVESRFQPRAKSPAGARGLMQLMPATASAMARELDRPVARVYEPEFNVEAGSVYLLKLLDRFDGDETLALASYNAGAGNVGKWMANDGTLPPRSLQYVESVQRARLRFVAMRQERSGSPEDRTMLASAPSRSEPEPTPEVPPPPARPSASSTPRSEPAAPTPEPVNPLAPSPDVYRPEPTPEPPLADTPYPPLTERRPSRAALDEDDEPVEVRRPRSLPSVLDE
ncbi:lytic transglycosylase domain-containing protein [Paraliomyxa miuraensis]|uniref:lytic transglycosylase domain-containing protein n=1 Tax=Paraliomyxa miuraensis TaxID=376150 RepID=UPI00225575A5|nr:transglycosylase SLT domain-containing protein [Paraliomyxa miuraensis]MCX4239514.1 transglycosylase SLT domain-containing protein [Paraliomyxa miuraensis]